MRIVIAVALAMLSSGLDQAVSTPRDLTIKTERRTELPRGTDVTLETLYIRGARQRRETIHAGAAQTAVLLPITIVQCDEKRTVLLDARTRLFAIEPHRRTSVLPSLDVEERADPNAPLVLVTIDAVDTGERRQVGSLVARHVKTTTITERHRGSRLPRDVQQHDGWYLDLPSANCDRAEADAFLLLREDNERVQVEQRGTARRGYAIEETYSSNGVALTTKLVEFSEAPLDAALFTVPPDYRPALPRLGGGHDLTRPDTFVNRLQSYWDELVLWTSSVFR